MMEYFLLIIHGDVDPEIIGTFIDRDSRDESAYKYRKVNDPEGNDGIFALETHFGKKPSVSSYSAAFFEEER